MTQRYIMLFQYGSNMDPNRLNSAGRLGGDAHIVGVGRLKGWGIRFDLYSENNQSGVTDIVPSSREHVEGILYQVPYRLVVSLAPSVLGWMKSRAQDSARRATTSDRKS